MQPRKTTNPSNHSSNPAIQFKLEGIHARRMALPFVTSSRPFRDDLFSEDNQCSLPVEPHEKGRCRHGLQRASSKPRAFEQHDSVVYADSEAIRRAMSGNRQEKSRSLQGSARQGIRTRIGKPENTSRKLIFELQGLGHLRIRSAGIPAKRYLQATLSLGDYKMLKDWLRKNGLHTYYFSVRIMANTGVRVSELVRLTADDARRGYGDVRGKGGKLRRVYFPEGLQTELEEWVGSQEPRRPLMLNRFGKPLSVRGLSGQLKVYAQKCGINPALVHPHAFRHLFARQFLAHGGDIALLADLLGHSSLETTRIYLRQPVEEQRRHIDELVCW